MYFSGSFSVRSQILTVVLIIIKSPLIYEISLVIKLLLVLGGSLLPPPSFCKHSKKCSCGNYWMDVDEIWF